MEVLIGREIRKNLKGIIKVEENYQGSYKTAK